jgi:hypothetical protein
MRGFFLLQGVSLVRQISFKDSSDHAHDCFQERVASAAVAASRRIASAVDSVRSAHDPVEFLEPAQFILWRIPGQN